MKTERTVTVTVQKHRPVDFQMMIARPQPQAQPTHRLIHRTILVDQTKRQCPACQTPQWIDDDESTCLCCRRARQHNVNQRG